MHTILSCFIFELLLIKAVYFMLKYFFRFQLKEYFITLKNVIYLSLPSAKTTTSNPGLTSAPMKPAHRAAVVSVMADDLR